MSSTTAQLQSFDKLLIGGRFVPSSDDSVIEVISPTTEEVLATVPAATKADVDAAVASAREAFDNGPWPRMTPAERAAALRRVGTEVGKRYDAMVDAFTREIGAPTAVSKAFHDLALSMWEDAAATAEALALEEERTWADGSATVVREPVGVVATIIPWNGPVGTASLKLSPALAAGCTAILKPAPEGPVSVMLLAQALEAAGLPEGVVSVLPADREVGEYLVTHPDVDKVSFTGSTAAGRRIMGLCAERIRPVNLELGGKSAAIVLEDADLESALPAIVGAGVGHSGQVCAALTRILAPRSRYEEVVEGVRQTLSGFAVGDPEDANTVLGPLAAERQRTRVEEYIRIGREEGARVVCGGGRPAELEKGWYVEPTLFADVENSMRIAQEEIFGPVLVVIPFDDVDDAVRIANDSIYGLSGAVFTGDDALGQQVARRVRTGQMTVNGWGMCVVQPFGGYKQSGLGREGGPEGVSEYFETKVIQTAG